MTIYRYIPVLTRGDSLIHAVIVCAAGPEPIVIKPDDLFLIEVRNVVGITNVTIVGLITDERPARIITESVNDVVPVDSNCTDNAAGICVIITAGY